VTKVVCTVNEIPPLIRRLAKELVRLRRKSLPSSEKHMFSGLPPIMADGADILDYQVLAMSENGVSSASRARGTAPQVFFRSSARNAPLALSWTDPAGKV
jgi:hypothetical protein